MDSCKICPWRAEVIDLYVKDLVLEYTSPLEQDREVTFRAVLINQGNVDASNFIVTWELQKVETREVLPLNQIDVMPPDYSLQVHQVISNDLPLGNNGLDEYQKQNSETKISQTFAYTIQKVSYTHAVLPPQKQSKDSAIAFKYTFDQPGTYRISFIADPQNQTSDYFATNNQLMREFVVQSRPLPPLPLPTFNPSPNQFSPTSGKAGDRIKLLGNNFNVGSAKVRFGSLDAKIVEIPSATEIVAEVPSISLSNVRITVETEGGTVTSTDSFYVVKSYSASAIAIGASLL